MNEKPLVVLTALHWEGKAVLASLDRTARRGKGVWEGYWEGQRVWVVVGGIGPRRAKRAADALASVPLQAMVSAGCAGALAMGVAAGTLVLSQEVRMYEEGVLRSFAANPNLLQVAEVAAARAKIPVVRGAVFTSPEVLFTPEEKKLWGQRTGAVAVEMESGVHAAFAQRRNLPFVALRIILDPAHRTIPQISGFTTPAGEARPLKTFSHLIAHPQHLFDLWYLKRCRARTEAALRQLFAAFLPLLATRWEKAKEVRL